MPHIAAHGMSSFCYWIQWNLGKMSVMVATISLTSLVSLVLSASDSAVALLLQAAIGPCLGVM